VKVQCDTEKYHEGEERINLKTLGTDEENERDCLERLREDNKHTIGLLGPEFGWEAGNRAAFVMEYMPMPLTEYVNNSNLSAEITRVPYFATYAMQLLEAVEFIHSKNILHRDLGLRNILIDPSKRMLKLADFGLAVLDFAPGQPLNDEVLEEYAAPELHLAPFEKHYGFPVDMWAVGVIIARMTWMPNGPLFKVRYSSNNKVRLTTGRRFALLEVVGWTPTKSLKCKNCRGNAEQIKDEDAKDDERREIFTSKSGKVLDDVNKVGKKCPNGPIHLLKGLLCPLPDERLSASNAIDLCVKNTFGNELPQL
jgi:serine/threonine protein kinase